MAAFTLVYQAITSAMLLSSELIFCLENERTNFALNLIIARVNVV